MLTRLTPLLCLFAVTGCAVPPTPLFARVSLFLAAFYAVWAWRQCTAS